VTNDLTANASVGEYYQYFLYPDSRAGEKRRNSLLSYSGGLVKRLGAGNSASLDVQVQRNHSNLGVAPPADELDILLNRTSSLGTYQKRVISITLSHSF
jgi:hypothetical protein